MNEQHLNEVCRPGQGAISCSYLGMGGAGWRCLKIHDGLKDAIDARRAANTMRAMGDNCEGDSDFLTVPPLTAHNATCK